MYLDAFTEHFASIEDPRQAVKISYPLFDIMFVTLCGVIAGAEGWKEIQEYAEGHHNWLKKQVFLQTVCLLMIRLRGSLPVLIQKNLVSALLPGCSRLIN